jgi:hypothetical protein
VENPPNEGCFLGWRKGGFDGFYQDLPPPASIAKSEATLASDTRRVFKLITADLQQSRN